MSLSPRGVLIAVLGLIRFALGLAASVLSIGLLALFALQFVHAPRLEATVLVRELHRYLDAYIHTVSRWFGFAWPSGTRINYIPAGLAVALWIVKGILDSIVQRADFIVRRTFKVTNRAGLRRPEDSEQAQNSLRKLNAESAHHREILLKRYREIEGALKSSSRKQCTFLSIDVVGSTKMKIGERATAVAATFQAYEELVRNIFESYSVWKQTWTPDGVMSCFLDRELGVAAAQQVLSSLGKFNADENQMRMPFEVRCGLNEGEVLIFDDSQLEKVADRTIDVAGHMQKFAAVNTLWLSADVYGKLEHKENFQPVESEVDGFAVFEWKPTLGAVENRPGESDHPG